ncbi:hypothetical protein DUNSADRAFT_14462 [Dunaliella salina]|uniref:Ubiquitin-like domain-containing protein n=1 Tax=Dunaliella salina TaxID=3046 RepID=A0ABQ7H9L3_DUNSA|nr:hypothetical protein DUNSADRAFT_14462 [Dunaliella salina]|eukprot:KAF5843546.1 hypothetical protein DUNSADRAFT_14462 [Dunaliella salina]
MTVETLCLDPVHLACAGPDLSAKGVLEQAAKQLGWQPTSTLHRLENFNEPWERLIFRGREIKDNQDLPAAGMKEGDKVVVVRRALCADGWKVAMADDFFSDDDA